MLANFFNDQRRDLKGISNSSILNTESSSGIKSDNSRQKIRIKYALPLRSKIMDSECFSPQFIVLK